MACFPYRNQIPEKQNTRLSEFLLSAEHYFKCMQQTTSLHLLAHNTRCVLFFSAWRAENHPLQHVPLRCLSEGARIHRAHISLITSLCLFRRNWVNARRPVRRNNASMHTMQI